MKTNSASTLWGEVNEVYICYVVFYIFHCKWFAWECVTWILAMWQTWSLWSRMEQLLCCWNITLAYSAKYFKLTGNPVGRKRITWKYSVDEQLGARQSPAPGDSCPVPIFLLLAKTTIRASCWRVLLHFLSTPGQRYFSCHLHYKAVEYKAHDSPSGGERDRRLFHSVCCSSSWPLDHRYTYPKGEIFECLSMCTSMDGSKTSLHWDHLCLIFSAYSLCAVFFSSSFLSACS